MYCFANSCGGLSYREYEALALGIPVVATRSAGSVITSGVDGYIVPERDITALADAITEITSRRRNSQLDERRGYSHSTGVL